MAENQYVVFSLCGEEYAIDILKVNEINRLKEIKITKIPKTPDYIDGIINLRGDVVPILNLRKKFHMKHRDIDKETRIVIVKIDSKIIGLLVDSVSHVLTLEEKEISPPPEEIKISSQYIVGVGKKGSRMIFILDIEKLFDSSERKEIMQIDDKRE
ncbi:chemotaxis protein CheW [Caminicella sporogenes]|uniref:chemotaxis protein CheW n=1 Tax=Caminicella sporogenes TaxID=166485 RepID=UPI00254037F6|nr:chemotaxis protein CheW [Caminicella sporogenes]WIF95813.1 chemotaxis protein CheW [Caminicella sporogenes]